jgi:hypothetical protein
MSIFIWKSAMRSASSTIIQYKGNDWIMEEGDTSSTAYQYLDYCTIPNATVIRAKKMPSDWIGSTLLEKQELPYQLLHENVDGRLELVGDWLRYISFVQDKFEYDVLVHRYSVIRELCKSEQLGI